MNFPKTTAAFFLLLLHFFPTAAQQPLSLSLSGCRERALACSEVLQQAGNKLSQSRLDREIAATAYLPKLEASAMGAYIFPDMDMAGAELRMRGSYMAGITLTQPLYAGGRIVSGRRLARIGSEAAAEEQRMSRMDVIVEADRAYWTCVAVGRKVRMLESYCSRMDTLHRQISTALAAGMATEADLLRIEAERGNIRYQLRKARSGAELCRLSLCQIVGAEPGTRLLLTDTLPAVAPPALPETSVEARPELHLLEHQIEAGEQQVRMARADMLPTVGLTAGYSYYGNIKLQGLADAGGGKAVPYTQEFRDGMGMVMLAVKVPLFRWGETRKKVRKARFDVQNARLELSRSARLLRIEAEQAARNVDDGYLLLQTAETALRQARENLRVMQNRYAASMSPLTDLLEAQSQWQQAESNLIEARTQCKIYETEYLRATGRLE